VPHRKSSRRHSGRRTIDKLLDATLYLFDAGCTLPACTVELVCSEARVSQGLIYRRYNSSDAFLSAIFLRYLDRALAAPPEELTASLYRPNLEDTAERVVRALMRPYQNNPQMHRAMEQFLQLQPNTEYAAQAPERISEYMRHVAAVLIPHRALFAHPDPERAAMIAVLNTASAIEDTFFLLGPGWDNALPHTTQLFVAERSKALIAYLRAMPTAGPPRISPQDF
jgi:AcrR family transcriptional regulator